MLTLAFSHVKQFDFAWAPAGGADYYQLWERPEPDAELVQLGADIMGESVSWARPLHLRFAASYILKACNGDGCSDSAAVDVVDSLVEAVGYLKASNTDEGDWFGDTVALSGDGNTLAVGAPFEASAATGIDGSRVDNSTGDSGAVYVFVRDADDGWSQQAYVKASKAGVQRYFGGALALSDDGDTLAVGAWGDDSGATGIGGSQSDNSALNAGAAYVFVRGGSDDWSQQAYVKASNTEVGGFFGLTLALSGDGNTLAVGTQNEDSDATGIDGIQDSDSASGAGAVYVFVRDGNDDWSQQAYVKASNTGASVLTAMSCTSTLRRGREGPSGCRLRECSSRSFELDEIERSIQ